MTGKLDLSLVIACYNEEPLLEKSVNEIFRILDTTRWNYELIFVDDLSRDKTREIIGRIIGAYKDKRIKKSSMIKMLAEVELSQTESG